MARQAPEDRLFERTLLGMLVCGFLALAATGELSPVVLGLSALGFTVRFLLLLAGRPVPVSPLAVNLLVLVYTGFYPLDILYVNRDFLGATVRLICFLTVVKGLSFRTDRDANYAVLIGFTQLLAAALLSSNLFFFVFLMLFLYFGVATFAVWEVRRGARGARSSQAGGRRGFQWRILMVSGVASLGILFFTVGLFFALPRTARAALQNLVNQKFHLPGFGGEIDLRRIGEIQTSTRTVMYVKILDQPAQLPFRWRGGAMSNFDGKRWTSSGDLAEQLRLRYGAATLPMRTHFGRRGVRVTYDVQLTETGMNAFFIAGIPEYLEANVPSIALLSNGSVRTLSGMPPILRYTVRSFLDANGGDGTVALNRQETQRLTALPATFDPRVHELAARVAGGETHPGARALRLSAYLQKTYGYTLDLPAEEQVDPMSHFLFVRKQGHCEYFASSLALMLRSLGTPARVVTGFQGGTLNPVSGWYTVRAADAHSWVEAFVPGNGWTTFDPTPAGPRVTNPAFLARFGQLVEAADLFWQDWVMQYDPERQFRLAGQIEQTRFGAGSTSLTGRMEQLGERFRQAGTFLKEHVLALVALVLLIVAGWLLGPVVVRGWRQKEQRKRISAGRVAAADATILYQNMLGLLEENKVRKPVWFTPLEFAGKLPEASLSREVADFTAAYNRLRFGNEAAAGAEMLVLMDRIRERLRAAENSH